MYGSIFAGPALEHDNTPVVRYQDLHRTHAPASAGVPEIADLGSARADAEYGADHMFSDPENPAYTYSVDLAVDPPSVEVVYAPAGQYTGTVTKTADRKTYNRAVSLAKKEQSASENLYASASQRDRASDEGGIDWSRLASAVGEGVTRGLGGGGKKKDTFRPSGRDSRPVSNSQPVKEESKVGTYLLIGGASLLGIGILAAAISASRRRGEE